jgi:hypothetical protein
MLLHSILFAAFVFQLLTTVLLGPSSAVSIHLIGGRPTFLVPSGSLNVGVLQGWSSSVLNSCLSQPHNSCSFN